MKENIKIITLNEINRKMYSNRLILIFNQSYQANHNHINELYGAKRYQDLCKYMDENKAICRILFVNELLCGYIWFFKINEDRIHLNEFAIEKEWKKKGLGQILINEVYTYAKENGCKAVELYVAEKNDEANHFYLMQGFETERKLMIKTI